MALSAHIRPLRLLALMLACVFVLASFAADERTKHTSTLRSPAFQSALASATTDDILALRADSAQSFSDLYAYYAAIDDQSDSLLLRALFDTIRHGLRFHYGTQGIGYQSGEYYTGTWNYFPLTDSRSDSTIWDMYSLTRRYFPHDGGSACGIEIEHCLPKSWWGWTKNDTASSKRAYQDLYILNPADGQANGQKSNYPPGHVLYGDKFDNGSFRMDSKSKSQYGWMCFEPAPCYRGDFARTYFYVATAYADLPFGAGNADYLRYLSTDSYLVFRPWLVQVLLDWHRSDPVSEKERARADAIFAIQHNRNPFIDFPDLVEYIWGNRQGQAVDLSSLPTTISSSYPLTADSADLRLFVPVVDSLVTFSWTHIDTAYSLHLYRRSYQGAVDTLVAMPAMGQTHINAAANVHTTGRVSSTASGTNAITMGVSSTDGAVVVTDLALTAPALLRFRAGLYKTATSATLHVFFNASSSPDTILSLPTSRDETWYTIPLPSGTDSVRILSVGGSTSKRACLQSLFVLQGERTALVDTLPLSPVHVQASSVVGSRVSCLLDLRPYASDTLYCIVTTSSSRLSNEQVLLLPDAPTAILPSYEQRASSVRKVFYRGQVLVLRDDAYFDLLGRPVWL